MLDWEESFYSTKYVGDHYKLYNPSPQIPLREEINDLCFKNPFIIVEKLQKISFYHQYKISLLGTESVPTQ